MGQGVLLTSNFISSCCGRCEEEGKGLYKFNIKHMKICSLYDPN